MSERLMAPLAAEKLNFIINRVNVGVFVLNASFEIEFWNHFMATSSGVSEQAAVGENLFTLFPDLPENWLKRKINGVFLLKNFSFTTWKQRPFLFKFSHNRPVTVDIDFMRQNCTFMPIRNDAGEIEQVCVVLQDATDECVYDAMLADSMEQLKTASVTDGLTGLFNRKHWEERLQEEFSRCQRYDQTCSLIMFDLDKFKNINDNYGHLAGDEVIRRVASIAAEKVRDSDVVGRYGGEEFGIVLPGTLQSGAVTLAERIRKEVESTPIDFEGTDLPVTVSLGVSEYSKDLQRYEKLIAQADEALYQAKQNGRNQVVAA